MNEPKETVLISACLMGVSCQYNGKNKCHAHLNQLMEKVTLIPVCPEILGGMPTPRDPSERLGDRVVTKTGQDVTEAFGKGAAETLRLAKLYGCRLAVLKQRSPSCGSGSIYDGSFTGTVIPGYGVTAALLEKNGIHVMDESELDSLLEKK